MEVLDTALITMEAGDSLIMVMDGLIHTMVGDILITAIAILTMAMVTITLIIIPLTMVMEDIITIILTIAEGEIQIIMLQEQQPLVETTIVILEEVLIIQMLGDRLPQIEEAHILPIIKENHLLQLEEVEVLTLKARPIEEQPIIEATLDRPATQQDRLALTR